MTTTTILTDEWISDSVRTILAGLDIDRALYAHLAQCRTNGINSFVDMLLFNHVLDILASNSVEFDELLLVEDDEGYTHTDKWVINNLNCVITPMVQSMLHLGR